jgi:hypothetical protein
MSKYQPLTHFLAGKAAGQVAMSFADVERVLGFRLPQSAYQHPAWWANDTSKSHVQAKAWLGAGYQTQQVNNKAKKLVFVRIRKPAFGAGAAETHREFRSEATTKGAGRHPALGSMKGTFTIEPGYDLTAPMYTDKEWAEIEKEMAEDWDQIERGMSGKSK